MSIYLYSIHDFFLFLKISSFFIQYILIIISPTFALPYSFQPPLSFTLHIHILSLSLEKNRLLRDDDRKWQNKIKLDEWKQYHIQVGHGNSTGDKDSQEQAQESETHPFTQPRVPLLLPDVLHPLRVLYIFGLPVDSLSSEGRDLMEMFNLDSLCIMYGGWCFHLFPSTASGSISGDD